MHSYSREKPVELLLDFVKNQGESPKSINEIEERINKLINYEPKVGVFGKTGVGKSSLCNALFGKDVCEIDDIAACTREPKEVLLSIGNKKLKLIDLPGAGENKERDKEYAELYKKLLPELDLIFWVLKGDDRAFTSDQEFFKKLVHPYCENGKPFLMIINQVDKIEPYKEWDDKKGIPSSKQLDNIKKKCEEVERTFNLELEQIVPVSANEQYGLKELVDRIIHALPREQKKIMLDIIEEDEVEKYKAEAEKAKAEAEKAKAKIEEILHTIPPQRKGKISDEAREEAEKAWWDTITEIFMAALGKSKEKIHELIAQVFSSF
ncbi:GTPase family protein [Anabaena sp. CCY 0017]|uniref:GTPase family protein n=1 Tax=Anabaena sp. CCY 0017 TaxID=3103866 RepID=UPI0039C6698D